MDTCASGERDPRTAARMADGTAGRGVSGRVIGGGFGSEGKGLVVAFTGGYRPWMFEHDRFIHNDLVRRSGAIVFSSATGDQVA
jgi:hypothetical protein